MKKNLWLVCVILLTATLTACSSDEPGNPNNDATDTHEDGSDSDSTDGEGDTDSTDEDADGEDDADSTDEDVDGDIEEKGCLTFGVNPGIAAENLEGTDSDGDQVCDSDEPLACLGNTDCDGDGLTDAQEIFYNDTLVDGTHYPTNPTNADTDGNGTNDLDDITGGNNPISNLDDIDPSAFSPTFEGVGYSAVSSLAIASSDCCFTTIDDDPTTVDNSLAEVFVSLGGLLGGFGGDDLSPAGIATRLQKFIDDGTLSLIFEYNNLPEALDAEPGRGDVSIGFWRANTVVSEEADTGCIGPTDCTTNPNGVCSNGDCVYLTTDKDARLAGEGDYPLETQIVDAETNPVTLTAAAGQGQLLVSQGDLVFSFNPALIFGSTAATFGLPESLDLTITNIKIDSDIQEQTGTQPTSGTTALGVATDGELELGGAIHIHFITDLVNDMLGPCYEGEEPLLTLVEDQELGRVTIECLTPFPAATDNTSNICSAISGPEATIQFADICGQIDTLIGKNIEVDTDGDDLDDSVSIGMIFEMVGASNSYPMTTP